MEIYKDQKDQSNGFVGDTTPVYRRTMLGGVEAIHVATVLEDCVDQLAILGRIMPTSYIDRDDAEQLVGDEISQLVDQQRQLEAQYENFMDKKSQIRGDTKSIREKRAQAAKEVGGVGRNLTNSTHVFARSLKQSPLTQDNMEKAQGDRAFLEHVLYGTLVELSSTGDFGTLVDAVKLQQQRKKALQETILKEEEGRKRVRLLQKQLQDVKKEKEVELQQRNEMIAHYKDQLQEMKAKTSMEGKYIKKVAETSVAQTQKRCTMSEEQLKEDIKTVDIKIEDEVRVNMEIETYLRSHTERLQKLVEHWMNKYDKDVDAKQKELDILINSKAKDLQRLQELTKLYAEYEQVVVEDRVEKEKARRKAEQEAEELKKSVRVQSWWRGIMVRRGLGPYSKKKKKKGKGKKSGKKKKK